MWFLPILVWFMSPCDGLCDFNLLDLLCCESVFALTDPANLPQRGSLQLHSQNNWSLFSASKKEKVGLSLLSMWNFSLSSRCVSPHLSGLFPGWMTFLQQRKRGKKTHTHTNTPIRQTHVVSESKTNTGPSAHTSRGLLTRLASSVMLTHFMICSFSEWRTVSPLSRTKENTCLSLPNPGPRLSSLDSFGPL